MTDRDTITRTRARASGAVGQSPTTAVHYRILSPDSEREQCSDHEMYEGRRQTGCRSAHAGSRLKLRDVPGRFRLICQPSSRTGENPPYGMIGGIEETSASFEARSAPRSYPTECKSPCGCDKGPLLETIVASHQFRTEVARLGSRSDNFEVFGGNTGCAVTGVVVLGVEVFQVAAERGLGRFAKPGECFQSRAVMNPIELNRFRN